MKKDPLGDFLTAYEEYLGGQRTYQDLPTFPAATPSLTPGDKMRFSELALHRFGDTVQLVGGIWADGDNA